MIGLVSTFYFERDLLITSDGLWLKRGSPFIVGLRSIFTESPNLHEEMLNLYIPFLDTKEIDI